MTKKNHISRICAFLLLNVTFFIYSLVSIFSKLAATQAGINIRFLLCYGMVLFLLMLYALLWQQNLKHLSLIVAYSNKAITVIWGMVWGAILFHEKITVFQIVGAAIIVVGVCIMASQSEDAG